MNMDIMF